MKIIKLFFCSLALMFISGFAAFARPVSAQTTFPVDQAGMAAYIKLDAFTLANFENAKQKLFDSVEAVGETYVVGAAKYEIDDLIHNKVNFHIYLGTNGWLVVYLLKTEEPSRMVNWRTGAPLSETMLKVVAEDAIQKIGATATGQLKYYNFAFPEASKITLAKQKLSDAPSEILTNLNKTINIFVPGTLYQASYSVQSVNLPDSAEQPTGLYLGFGSNPVGTVRGNGFNYGFYSSKSFMANKNIEIYLERVGSKARYVSAVTAAVYKP